MLKPIKTKKFILRAPVFSDAKFVADHLNDIEISQFLSSVPKPYLLKHAKDWIRKTAKVNGKDKYSYFVEIDGEVCGGISLESFRDGFKCEIGYWLAKKHWGKGLTTEMVKEMIKLAFKKLKMKRIDAQVYANNPASMRVLEKCGFKKEGIARNGAKHLKKVIDMHVFSLIPEDLK